MVFERGAFFFGFSSLVATLLDEGGREAVGEDAAAVWSGVTEGLWELGESTGDGSRAAPGLRRTEVSIERGICEK